ncbi:MAG TPA: alkane 1-monooxygenase [Steroidobacteraceae bacterium]
MLKYLRYLGIYLFACVTTLGLALGGGWMWLGVGFVYLVMTFGDELLGDDYSEPGYRYPVVLNALLYLAVPMLALMCFVMAWMAGSGDLFGLGAWVQGHVGIDMFAGRAATGPLAWLGGVLSAGWSFAAVGTNVGHELTHRTTDRKAMLVGRWLLALTLDAEFSIEHVYGHHRRLATAQDPASARRGEQFYGFLVRSIVGQTRSAWMLETERLAKFGLPALTWRNRMLRGWAMSAAIAALFFAAAGPVGVVVFLATALYGRTILEAVNYFEHYGLVREIDQPVEPRHSWNTNRRLTNAVLFNLARHSHHHAEGDAQFWRLRAYRDAPTLPYGYLSCMLFVYIAPTWYRNRMTPLVLDWDRRFASPAERRLAEQANRESGLRELTLAAGAA